jgi:hypothetical protein
MPSPLCANRCDSYYLHHLLLLVVLLLLLLQLRMLPGFSGPGWFPSLRELSVLGYVAAADKDLHALVRPLAGCCCCAAALQLLSNKGRPCKRRSTVTISMGTNSSPC